MITTHSIPSSRFEDYASLHTGHDAGFSWLPCQCCGSTLGGDRFEFFGLKHSSDTPGMKPESLGTCCIDCLYAIE